MKYFITHVCLEDLKHATIISLSKYLGRNTDLYPPYDKPQALSLMRGNNYS